MLRVATKGFFHAITTAQRTVSCDGRRQPIPTGFAVAETVENAIEWSLPRPRWLFAVVASLDADAKYALVAIEQG